MIATPLQNLGGFGFDRTYRSTSAWQLVHAPPNSPLRQIVSHPDGYYLPDCGPWEQ
ncbi:MAG: hypothetical protein R3F37_12690 [Candidatus Competibacteraceae bacterium]